MSARSYVRSTYDTRALPSFSVVTILNGTSYFGAFNRTSLSKISYQPAGNLSRFRTALDVIDESEKRDGESRNSWRRGNRNIWFESFGRQINVVEAFFLVSPGLGSEISREIKVTRRTYTTACTDARAFVARSRVETQ